MAKILDGKALALKIKEGLRAQTSLLKDKPGLAVVLVGDDPASQIYVNGKEKACEAVGFYSKRIDLDSSISEAELLEVVDELNQNKNIHGFIVQLPLPKHINSDRVIESILPHKDADGFCPINLGKMMIGQNQLVPATPKGVMTLIDEYKIDLAGKHAVVLGRSNIVGKPISLLLQQRNATVTMCHSKTKNLSEITKQADIIVAAIGKPHFLKMDMIKDGTIIIDVGTSRLNNGKLAGDVDKNCYDKASFVSPVPGGVGPLTIAMLLENTLECYRIQKKL